MVYTKNAERCNDGQEMLNNDAFSTLPNISEQECVPMKVYNWENDYCLGYTNHKCQVSLVLEKFRFSLVGCLYPLNIGVYSGESVEMCNIHEFGTNYVVLTYTAKGVYFTVFTLKKKWKYMILKVSPLLLWKKNLCILSKISFKMFIDIFSSNYWGGEKNHYFSDKFIYAHYWNGIISYKSSILVNFRIHYFLWAKDFDKMLIIPFQLTQWL